MRRLVLGLWAAIISSSVATTSAQDLSGPLPEPITTLDLMRYTERLELNESQCEAIRGRHDEYKQLYRELHESEILPALRRFVFQPWTLKVDRNHLEKYLDRMDTLMRRIRSCDVHFFAQMQDVLTQEQLVRLGAIERERERYRLYARYAQASLVQWPRFAFVEVVRDLGLEAPIAEVVDALLAEYELTLTSKLRTLAISAQQTFVDAEIAGRLTVNDADKSQEELDSILSDALGPIVEQVQDLREHYLQTYRLMADVLPKQSTRQVRSALCEAMYRDILIVTRRLRGGKETVIALSAKGFSPEQREAIVAGENERRNRLDPILEEALVAAHEYYGSTSILESRPEIEEVFRQDLDRLVSRAREVDEHARERLKAIVGQGRYKKLRAESTSGHSKRQRQRGSLTAQGAGVSETALIGAAKADARLPGPLGAQELDRYTWLLDATDEQILVIRVHHQDYTEEFEQHLKATIGALADTCRKAQGATPYLHGINAKDLSRELESARQAISELDDDFFANVRFALHEEQAPRLERVRRARTRELHSFWCTLNADPIYVSRIDLLWLLRSMALSPARVTELDPLLVPYEEILTDLLIQMYDQHLEREDILLEYRLETGRLRVAEASDEQIQAAFQSVHPSLERNSERLRALDALIGQVNERTLSALVGALSPQDGRQLTTLFNRLAFPTVYRDPTYVGGVLEATLLNEDLPVEDINALQRSNVAYRGSYEEVSQGMVNVMSEIRNDLLTDDSRGRKERDEILRFLLFERNELNQRAIWRIRSIFRDADMDQPRGLPEPSAIKENIWRWQ